MNSFKEGTKLACIMGHMSHVTQKIMTFAISYKKMLFALQMHNKSKTLSYMGWILHTRTHLHVKECYPSVMHFIQGRCSNLHELWPATKDKGDKMMAFSIIYICYRNPDIFYHIAISLLVRQPISLKYKLN